MTNKEYLDYARDSLKQLTARLGVDIMVYGDERDENYDCDAYDCIHSIAMALDEYEKQLKVLEIFRKRMEYTYKHEPTAGYKLVKTYSFSISDYVSSVCDFNKVKEWLENE